ncbi:chromosome condensation regulator RCC1 [Nonomuraea sp. B19D2]|uniref:RCC1-like domain-containing protein n=1 Tax=Nonomuraea sp. B19D2 TaxID=3159561 RepID=UPI0032DBCAC1
MRPLFVRLRRWGKVALAVSLALPITLGTPVHPASAQKQVDRVKAWGRNSEGQLGDATTTDRHNPTTVAGLTAARVTSLVAGFNHNLALLSNGTVEAWGSNRFGQLGDVTTTNHPAPSTVRLSGVAAVAAGESHSLALGSNGLVAAWGLNSSGQLGDGTTRNRSTPVTVTGLTRVTAVAAGRFHSLALLSDGTVKAWGANRVGQLGDGTTFVSRTPVTVKGLTGVQAIAADGGHSLALLSDGTVKAWGWNRRGQLGDGTNINRSTPVTVTRLTRVTAIDAGGEHSLALLSDGSVKAWGRNRFGQLGDGSRTDRSTPVTVTGLGIAGLTDVLSIAAGSAHNLAQLSDGTVKSWGSNSAGQLGLGITINHHPLPFFAVPTTVVTGLDIVHLIAAGGEHSLAAFLIGSGPL